MKSSTQIIHGIHHCLTEIKQEVEAEVPRIEQLYLVENDNSSFAQENPLLTRKNSLPRKPSVKKM